MAVRPVEAVPYADYRALLSRHADAAQLLDAIEMFSPLNLAALVVRFNDILNTIDSRLAYLEYRLEQAGIKDLPEGIPDDQAEKYFTLPLLVNEP